MARRPPDGASSAWLDLLPDEPAFVEARGLLLEGRGVVVEGFDPWGASDDEGGDAGFFVADLASTAAVCIGTPSDAACVALLRRCPGLRELLAPGDDGAWLAEHFPRWRLEPGLLFALEVGDEPAAAPDPPPGEGPVPCLRLESLEAPELQGLPADWIAELARHLPRGPVDVALVEGQAVSYAHAFTHTERWWSLSVATLPAFRRRGLARAVCTQAIRTQLAAGRRPVWSTTPDNGPSRALARDLGLRPIGELCSAHRE